MGSDPVALAQQRTQLEQQKQQVSEAEGSQKQAQTQPAQPAAPAAQVDTSGVSLIASAVAHQVQQAFEPVATALQQSGQPQGVQLTPQQLQQVQQQTQQAGTVLTSPSQIDSKSKLLQGSLANPTKPADLTEMVKADAKATFIDPLIQHPLESFGLLGGGIALELLTGGAATPFLIAAGAAMAAPGTIAAVQAEMKNPNDSNLAQALVSVGAFASNIIPGRRYLPGLAGGRDVLNNEMGMVRDATEGEDVATAMGGWKDLKPGVPLRKQLDVLQFDPKKLKDQMVKKGLGRWDKVVADVNGKKVRESVFVTPHTDIRLLAERSDDLERKWNIMRETQKQIDAEIAPEGAEEQVTNLQQEIQQLLSSEIEPSRWRVSANHQFLPATHATHIGFDLTAMEKAVGADENDRYMKMVAELNQGWVEGASDLHFDSGHIPAVGAFEKLMATRAAGGAEGLESAMKLRWDGIVKHLGLTDADVELGYQALEEPEVWRALADHERGGEIRLFTRAYRDFADAVTVAEMRHGLIPTPMESASLHFFEQNRAEGAPEAPQAVKDATAIFEADSYPRSKAWQWVADFTKDRVNATAQMPRRSEQIAKEAERTKHSEDARKLQVLMKERKDEIEAARKEYKTRKRSLAIRQGRMERSPLHAKEREREAALQKATAELEGLPKETPEELQRQIATRTARAKELTQGVGKTDFTEELGNAQKRFALPRPPNVKGVSDFLDNAQGWGLDVRDVQQKVLDYAGEPSAAKWKAVVDSLGEVDPKSKPNEAVQAEQEQLQQELDALTEKQTAAAKRPGLEKRVAGMTGKTEPVMLGRLRAAHQEAQRLHDEFVNGVPGRFPDLDPELAKKLVTAKASELRDMRRIDPPDAVLTKGLAHLRKHIRLFAWQMEHAATRNIVESAGHTNLKALMEMYPDEKPKHLGKLVPAEMRSDMNGVLPGAVFRAGRGNEAAVAEANGYTQVFGQIGRPGELGFRDALYLPKGPGDELKAALNKAGTAPEFEKGLLGVFYKAAQAGRRAIMVLPFFHLTNLVPRMLTMVMSDPKFAIPALKEMPALLSDPVERSKLTSRFLLAGGMKANRFNVGNMARHALMQDTGEQHWPSFRSVVGQMEDWRERHIETTFWTGVHHMQLFAFRYAEEALRGRVPEGDLETASAMFATHVTGFVNPIYMTNVYKKLRGLMWFAPSYWGSFGQLMASMMPFKMAERLGEVGGGRFIRFTGVPLKFIDQSTKREWLRLQRNYSYSYLANAFVMQDMMNVILSGHHTWDNQPGHKFDIETSKLFGQERMPDGSSRPSYWTGMGWYRQANDVVNMLGLGHNWSLGGAFDDPTWDKMNHFQQATTAASALAQGAWREGISKMGPVPTSAYELGTGKSILSLEDGVNVGMPGGPLGALTNFLPAGSQELNAAKIYAQAISQETDPAKREQLIQLAKNDAISGAIQSTTGIPSVHYLGVERKSIGDDQIANWKTQRENLRSELAAASANVMNGSLPMNAYTKAKEQVLNRMIQLDSDTFGQETPEIQTLAQARAQLAQQYNLDQIGIPDSVWMERYSYFLQSWNALMEHASPQARSAWWDVERQNWTDADYLDWLGRQAKQALAASIDGQGGHRILAYERQIGNVIGLPLSTQARAALEAGDPYYQQYRTMLRSLRNSSALGALTGAFTSPIENVVVLPNGMTPDAAMAEFGSQATVLLPSTLQALVEEAKAVASEGDVEASGGEVQPQDIGLTGVTP